MQIPARRPRFARDLRKARQTRRPTRPSASARIARHGSFVATSREYQPSDSSGTAGNRGALAFTGFRSSVRGQASSPRLSGWSSARIFKSVAGWRFAPQCCAWQSVRRALPAHDVSRRFLPAGQRSLRIRRPQTCRVAPFPLVLGTLPGPIAQACLSASVNNERSYTMHSIGHTNLSALARASNLPAVHCRGLTRRSSGAPTAGRATAPRYSCFRAAVCWRPLNSTLGQMQMPTG